MSCASLAAMGSAMVSVSREARRALGGEGRDPFGVVRRAAELALVVTLDVQLLGEVAAEALVDRLLGARQPARWGAGEVARQVLDDAREFGILDAAPDEAPALGILGAELVTEEREPERARGADEPRQRPGAARIGHQPESCERLHEHPRARRHHEGAG